MDNSQKHTETYSTKHLNKKTSKNIQVELTKQICEVTEWIRWNTNNVGLVDGQSDCVCTP